MRAPHVLILFVLTAGVALAQDEKPERRTPRTGRSPFSFDEELQRLFGAREKDPEGTGFRPLDTRPALPPMSLKGLLRLKGRDRFAALVDIEGVGRFTVRENERLSFSLPGRLVPAGTTGSGAVAAASGSRTIDPREPSVSSGVEVDASPRANSAIRERIPLVLKVVHVGRDGVVVEVGTVGEVVIIR